MKKPLFESEDVNEFFRTCIPCGISDEFKDQIKIYMQEYGYIKKSIVEEAEDAYRKFYHLTDNDITGQEVIEIQNNAIQHLKNKLSEAEVRKV